MESFSSSSRSLLLRSMNLSDLQLASGSGILRERWLLLKSRIFKLSSTSSSARRVPERLLLFFFFSARSDRSSVSFFKQR
ncbi:hypothetical protein AAC387_Pa05g3765 [Persea americana]